MFVVEPKTIAELISQKNNHSIHFPFVVGTAEIPPTTIKPLKRGDDINHSAFCCFQPI